MPALSSNLQSSWMHAASWEDGKLTLRTTHGILVHLNVPKRTYDALINAASPGTFYNAVIKPRYRSA